MTGILLPTIGDQRPGPGLRVRRDTKASEPVADFRCPCGADGYAEGEGDVERLVLRYGRHRRDECPIPEVRDAAARQYRALERSLSKRRK